MIYKIPDPDDFEDYESGIFDFLSRSLTNLQERGPKPPKKWDGIQFEF
jgi:hypothetical protein